MVFEHERAVWGLGLADADEVIGGGDLGGGGCFDEGVSAIESEEGVAAELFDFGEARSSCEVLLGAW